MATLNTYMTQELAGVSQIGDYAGAAGDNAAVQVLIDLILPEGTEVIRGYMDQMSPECKRQVLKELYALQDAVDTTDTL